jgi:DNA-directed RNA polymerase specialized sigma subunit
MKAYDTYAKNRTPENLRAVVDEHQSFIDGVLRNTIGTPSAVVKTRADLLAADAIKKWDPSRGVPLKNYIGQSLMPMHRIAKQVTEIIGVPEQVRREAAALARAREELREALMREPSIEELADHTGIPMKRQRRIARNPIWTKSEGSYAEALENGDDDAEDNLPGVAVDPRKEVHDYVYSDLDDVDKQIMSHRIGYRGAPVLPNHIIAAKVNLSPGAVSQRATRIQDRIEETSKWV